MKGKFGGEGVSRRDEVSSHYMREGIQKQMPSRMAQGVKLKQNNQEIATQPAGPQNTQPT